MAKRRSQKLKSGRPPPNHPTTSKDITKKAEKKKKRNIGKTRNISVNSRPNNGPFSSNLDLVPTTITTSANTIVSSTNRVGLNKGKKKVKENNGSTSGFIFMCNGKTKHECYRFRVFGLPREKLKVVESIKHGMKLFLFDFDLKLLYGVYKATSKGELDLEPMAFNGKFPAQVKFRILKDCLPLPESSFKHAIRDNYQGGPRFRQELSSKQVRTLLSLFRPITVPSPTSVPPLLAPPFTEGPRAHLAQTSYSREHPLRALPVYPKSEDSDQAVYHRRYDKYEPETRITYVQPSVETRRIHLDDVPHYSKRHFCLEPHQPYLPEKPFVYPQETYRRSNVSIQTTPRDEVGYGHENHTIQLARERVAIPIPRDETGYGNEYHTMQLARERDLIPRDEVGYGNEYHTIQLAREREVIPGRDYYFNQSLPTPATSLLSQQAHAAASSSYQPYYPAHTFDNLSQVYVDRPPGRPVPGRSSLVEENYPASFSYSFVGHARTYR